MSEQPLADQPLATMDLAALVDEWVDWHRAAAVPSPGAGQQVPAAFIQDGLVVKGLPGLLTLMHDNGYDDREIIAWLFLDDDYPGRPIDALRENRGTEVKRRAQAMAF